MKKLEMNKFFEYEKNGINVILTESIETKAAYFKRIKKKKTIGRIIGYTLLFVFILNVLIMPLTGLLSRVKSVGAYSGNNQYIINNGLLISAHRAGGGLEPEETISAFKRCIEATDYSVDVLEFDLHLTKDNVLVLLHDHKLARTSNGEDLYFKNVKVCDLTLQELERVNFGYNFVDPITGEMPYHKDMTSEEIKDAGVGIVALNDLLDYVESMVSDKSMNYIIEIKDSGARGKKSMQLLYDAMNEKGIIDRTIVGTFQPDITKYIDDNYVKLGVTRSASIFEVADIYYSFLYGVKKDYKFGVLQIPMGLNGFFDLGTKAFIDFAHSMDIAVQYWTINDPDDVKKLYSNGADCIMTDDPSMVYKALGWDKVA